MERPDHTPPGADDPVYAALWKAHRRRMLDLAFRMLLDLGDAEDVVQEAFTRLARTNIADIDDPEGWLVVVTSRLCLDRLRARQRRPTQGLDVVDDAFDPRALEPSSQVTLVDNVTLAMHTLLERLSPAERTSFVLHDVFQYSFADVGAVVGRSPAACRQLTSRARRTLRAESSIGRFPVNSALQRQVSERFIEVCSGGDLEGLLALLDPAVDGAGDIVPTVAVGAADVARGILSYLGPPASPTLLHLPVGERVGIVAMRDRAVLAIVLLTIDDKGLVVHVDALAGEGPRAAVSTALGLGKARLDRAMRRQNARTNHC
jgi:RNA polymerase sigma-70 factor (ECF subfamily)